VCAVIIILLLNMSLGAFRFDQICEREEGGREEES